MILRVYPSENNAEQAGCKAHRLLFRALAGHGISSVRKTVDIHPGKPRIIRINK